MNDTTIVPITQFAKLIFQDYSSIEEITTMCQTKTDLDLSSDFGETAVIRKDSSIVSIQLDMDRKEIPNKKDVYRELGIAFDEEASLRPIYTLYDKASGRYIHPTGNSYIFSGKKIDKSLFKWTFYDAQDVTGVVSDVLSQIVADSCLNQTFDIAIRWLWGHAGSDTPTKHPNQPQESYKIIENVTIDDTNYLVAESVETTTYKYFYADILESGQIFLCNNANRIKVERQKLTSLRKLD